VGDEGRGGREMRGGGEQGFEGNDRQSRRLRRGP